MQSSRPIPRQATTTSDSDRHLARISQWLSAPLGFAILMCTAVSGAYAIEAQTTEGSSVEVPLASIVVETDAPTPPPGQDQLMKKFRETLGAPPDLTIAEHQLANGPLEITTRFGRLCAEPPPAQIESGLGGQITVTAPCAVF